MKLGGVMDTSDSQLLKQEGIGEHSMEKASNHFGVVAFNLAGYRFEGGPRWLFRRRELCRQHCRSRKRARN